MAVVVAAFVALAISDRQAADVATRRGLEQSADLVAQFLAGRERTLMGGARVFVQGPYFRTLVAERRRDDVLDQAFEAAEQIGADWVFITDENGVLLAKSDEPGVFGAAMGQVPLVAQALRGQVTSGFGASGDTALFQAVAVPIIAKRGAPVGVLVATKIVDSVFMHDVKAATSSDLLFYSRDDRGRAHAARATVAPMAQLSALIDELSSKASTSPTLQASQQNKSEPYDAPATARVGRIEYRVRGTTLSTYGGENVGGFVVLRARDAATSFVAFRTPFTIALTVGVFAALLSAWLAANRFTRPMRALQATVARAAEGQLNSAPKNSIIANGISELRELSESVAALLNDLRDKQALITVGRLHEQVADTALPPATVPPRVSRVAGFRTTGVAASAQLQINRPGLVLQSGALLANRYVIESEIGRGGLGIVYRARDRVLAETIAIKMLRPETVANDPTAFERLKSELRVTRKISHRNVVRTYDLGESGDAPFLTMEYVDGASLATIIQARGPLSLAAVVAIAKQLLRALAVAHEHGIIHGDLKPQNLLIDANGLLKITDFGVARLMRSARATRAAEPDNLSAARPNARPNARLTGAILGTPEYMAPEQLIGEPSSLRTDIYAAGAVLQECLSGATPYNADTPIAFVARKMTPEEMTVNTPVRAVDVTDANARIAAIVQRMIDPQADTRPFSARELLTSFTSFE